MFLDLFLIKMLTGFAAKPALWFGTLSFPVVALGLGSLLWILTMETSGIIFPTVAFLFFCLAGHLLVMGILGEFIVNTGDYRPARLIAENGTKDLLMSVGF